MNWNVHEGGCQENLLKGQSLECLTSSHVFSVHTVFLELNGGTDIESTLVGSIRKVTFNLCMKCMKCQTSKLSLERLSVTVTVYLALKSHTFARLELKGEKMELSQSWNWWVASDKSLSYAGNA